MNQEPLKAPFPWFGGKSKVGPLVWERFGADIPNYVEPFLGSGAVLLARPGGAGPVETANDADGFVVNFWRAISHDPEAVAQWADQPVFECDLHARHAWLKPQRETLTRRLEGDPDWYDAKIAGWWVWGMAVWIGGGFCGPSSDGPWQIVDGQLVNLGHAGNGVTRKLVHLGHAGRGVTRKLVHLGDAGRGVTRKLVNLRGAGNGVKRQLVHLRHAGKGVKSGSGENGLPAWFEALQARLCRVRLCCGDFERVLGPTPTVLQGLTGVFLDPPYSADTGRDMGVYAQDCGDVARRCRDWALAHGDDPLMRIALCGYEGEHMMPDTWDCVAWKAHGGYGAGRGTNNQNKHRERIWFSPHCRAERDERTLFEGEETE